MKFVCKQIHEDLCSLSFSIVFLFIMLEFLDIDGRLRDWSWLFLIKFFFCLSFLEDEQELSVGVFDVTILFDSFIHIYLVFCICFVYKMPWYSLFYVLKAFLDERFKNEVIGGNWQIWPSVGVLCTVEALEIEMKWFQWHSKSNIHNFMES